jgi:cytochrome c oxidase assembly protein subunit 15
MQTVQASQSPSSSWLKRFSLLTAAVTFALIWMGGLVTSHNAGLAVPDWPNTYGYNMFFFPISKWVGNIYYEHTHRLVASVVGMS